MICVGVIVFELMHLVKKDDTTSLILKQSVSRLDSCLLPIDILLFSSPKRLDLAIEAWESLFFLASATQR